jgi:hypothetical protein
MLQYYRLDLQFSDFVEIGVRIVVIISLPMIIIIELEFRCGGVLIVFVVSCFCIDGSFVVIHYYCLMLFFGVG